MSNSLGRPDISFKNFTEEWNDYRLGDLMTLQNGFNGNGEVYGSGIPLISVMDILNNDFIVYDNIRGKASVTDEEAKRYSVEFGDVLFQRSSENFEDAGRSNVYLDKSKSAVFGGFVIRGKKTSEYEPRFMKYLLDSSYVRSQITSKAQGAQHINVSQDTLENILLRLPSLQEQNLIADLLSNLDKMKALEHCKYSQILSIKQSMLEKMFPQDEAKVPEIRFRGFDDNWEQCKLGDLGEIITGSTPSTQIKEYYSDSGIPWVTPTDISENITFNTEKRLSDLGESVGRVVPQGTILVTCIASIGKNTMLGTKGSFNQQINGIIPDTKKFYPYFLLTESNLWSQKMKQSAAAGTMQIVNKAEFSDIITEVPSFNEQRKIGDLFEIIDNLIALHQRKFEQLQNIKKSYLEKMFVS